jgi:cation transport ATPase
MMRTIPARTWAWLRRRSALVLLVVTLSGLVAGGLARLAGAGAIADAAWLASAACGLGYAVWSAAESLRHGRVGVDIIALLAVVGAVAVGELLAAAVISVMLTSGRSLEEWAAERARHDLSALLGRAPRTARRYRGGALETVPLDDIAIGDVLLVAPGDVLPVDGSVTSGIAILDESALTGEALPVEHGPGDGVRSGTLNAGGPFDLRAGTSAADSTYAGIIRLVSEAERSQAPFVRLADRYAMWFLPLTLAVAAAAWTVGGPTRAVAVLVVATPCPLILAAPVALVSGLSAAARRGVVVKSSGVLERLARCTTMVLDKTGTLTVGQPVRHGGVRRIVLATGDRADAADAVGTLTGVDKVLAGLTPAQKLDAVRREQGRAPVIMIGDGINDAPALALADVGIALGARGSTASSEAADAVLTVDQLGRVGDVAALARRTRRIALQSVLAGMGMSLAAMGAAAAGLLPAVWGALLQEGIDVAVILNALRALRPPAPDVRTTAAYTALTRRFRTEHRAIRTDIEELRIAADTLEAPGAMTRVRLAYDKLTGEVWPHENAEETQLYPSLNRMLGGVDPTAPMSRAHAEIAYQIARLGRLIDEIGAGPPEESDIADLRGLLYGLHAILKLHTVQEDETYLSLGDDADTLAAG